LRDRYADDPEARFGLVASARDKDLARFGIPNQINQRWFPYGPWYVEGEGDYRGQSCRNLIDCVTEFGAQGLELDAALLAWGTDFIREQGRWSNRFAKSYQQRNRVVDPHQLRQNAYRVLLTRGRDGTVVFAPPIPMLDETYSYLRAAGFRPITEDA
jgi:schlafen family protein